MNTPASEEASLEDLLKNAEDGVTEAQFNLGNYYYNGKKIPPNYTALCARISETVPCR